MQRWRCKSSAGSFAKTNGLPLHKLFSYDTILSHAGYRFTVQACFSFLHLLWIYFSPAAYTTHLTSGKLEETHCLQLALQRGGLQGLQRQEPGAWAVFALGRHGASQSFFALSSEAQFISVCSLGSQGMLLRKCSFKSSERVGLVLQQWYEVQEKRMDLVRKLRVHLEQLHRRRCYTGQYERALNRVLMDVFSTNMSKKLTSSSTLSGSDVYRESNQVSICLCSSPFQLLCSAPRAERTG